MSTFEARRAVAAPAARIFALLADPAGHVAIDSSGLLRSARGGVVTGVGDQFVVLMDGEPLADGSVDAQDVTVTITRFEPDELIEWSVSGHVQPPVNHSFGYRLEPQDGGTLVTAYYDQSGRTDVADDRRAVGPEAALHSNLGILARVVGG